MSLSKPVRGLVTLAMVLSMAAQALSLSEDDVYYGSARRHAKAAEINTKKVFMAIPAYREIIEKQIDKDSALYFLKLKQANKVFREVVAKYARDNEYDLVCEEGKLEGAHNATDEIVEILKQRNG